MGIVKSGTRMLIALTVLTSVLFLSCASVHPRQGPDVAISQGDIILRNVTDDKVIIGHVVTANVTVHNVGSSNATDTTISLYDNGKMVDQTQITWNITPNSTAAGEVNWDTTGTTLGNHTLEIRVDCTGDINASNNSVSLMLIVRPVPKSHVYVHSIDLPYDALIGEDVSINVKVKNDGELSQKGDRLKFYDGSLPIGDVVVGELIPNDNTTEIEKTFVWNTTGAVPGGHKIKVVVNSSKASMYSHIINLTSPKPNVYILSVTVDKTHVLEGETVGVTAKVKNNGTKDAEDETIEIYLDDDTSPLDSKTRTIKVGDVKSVYFSWNTSGVAPGNHTLTVKIPSSNDPQASKTTSKIFVEERVAIVNMVSFTANPKTVKSGENVTLTANLENSGTLDAVGVEVVFYKNDLSIGIRKVDVAAGGTASASIVDVPITGENDTVVIYAAKFGRTVMNESVSVKSVVPKLPDLTIKDVNVPNEMTVGETYNISVVIENIGRADAENFTVKFNVGAEYPYIIDGLSLKIGESMNATWTFVPTLEGTGLKFKVQVDARMSIMEKDEFNNEFIVPNITVKPAPAPYIEIENVTLSKTKIDVEKGKMEKVKVTVLLKNSGKKDGNVDVVLKEKLRMVAEESNVTVPAETTVERVYVWNVTGAGTHTLKISIDGDTGIKTTKTVTIDVVETVPGFEVIAVLAGMLLIALLRRRGIGIRCE